MPENDRSNFQLSRSLTYTSGQRQILILILCLMLIYVVARWINNPTYISDPQPSEGARASELADRIDPEYADWQTLAILPGIGQAKANLIVAKRQERQEASPGKRAFERPEDLYTVKGIGVSTVERIKPYLIFSTNPTTRSTPD